MGILGNILATFINPGAAVIIESAVVTGVCAFLGALLINVTGIFHGEVAIIVGTAVIKGVQKVVAEYIAKRKLQV